MPNEVDLLIQCEKIHVAEDNSVMEWNDMVFETQLEMECTNIEVRTGEMYVRRNSYDVCDVTGLEADNYEMVWNDIELETDEVYIGQKYYEE
jgi:hypothetical protein